jgi:hypothetical protein
MVWHEDVTPYKCVVSRGMLTEDPERFMDSRIGENWSSLFSTHRHEINGTFEIEK